MADQIPIEQILSNPTPSKEDLRIIEREGVGTFRKIFVHYARFLLRGLPDCHDEAETLVHDFLVKFNERMESFKCMSSVLTYSRACIFNACMNRLRRQKKESRMVPSSDYLKEASVSYYTQVALDDFEGFDFAIEEEIWMKRLKQIAREFTDSLSPVGLRMLQYFYGKKSEKHSWQTIVNMLNLKSVDAAKRRRDRIRKKVAKYWIPRIVNECFPVANQENQTLAHRVYELFSTEGTEVTDVEKELTLQPGTVSKKLRMASDEFFRLAISMLPNSTSELGTTNYGASK